MRDRWGIRGTGILGHLIKDPVESVVRFAHLPNFELGAAMRLQTWLALNGAISVGDDKLPAITRTTRGQWRKIASLVLSTCEIKDGVILPNPDWVLSFEQRTTNAQLRGARMLAAQRLGTHSEAEWAALLRVFGGCTVCGRGPPVKDHVLPISKGGCDYIANIQPLCRSCNALKATTDQDFRNERAPDWVARLRMELS